MATPRKLCIQILQALGILTPGVQAPFISQVSSAASSSGSAAMSSGVIDGHIHNYSVVFGGAAVPTLTHFGDIETLTPFTATSGNGAFGAACNVVGSGDTPVRSGMTYFDPREVHVSAVSVNTTYIVRMIWGTAAQTEAQAEAAMQYSDLCVQNATVAAGFSFPQEVRMVRMASGSQLWAKVKNVTNLATMSFFIQIHEYPSPTP